METVQRMIAGAGGALLARLRYGAESLQLAATAIVEFFTPRFHNSATRSVVQKQIYFTAWRILPGIAIFTAVVSYTLVAITFTTARRFGLADYALEISVRVLVTEMLPLLIALFVALRSGAAINTEVALMHINNEMRALRATGVDPVRFELLPRVIGAAISVLSLTAVCCAISLACAYFVIYGPQAWGIEYFGAVIAKIFTPFVILVLWIKVSLFGLAVGVIPVVAGYSVPQKLHYAPISVLHGMMWLFFVLMLVEVASLALIYF